MGDRSVGHHFNLSIDLNAVLVVVLALLLVTPRITPVVVKPK
jgi:hypothetical protein